MFDQGAKPRGFGFVSFEEPEAAEKVSFCFEYLLLYHGVPVGCFIASADLNISFTLFILLRSVATGEKIYILY